MFQFTIENKTYCMLNNFANICVLTFSNANCFLDHPKYLESCFKMGDVPGGSLWPPGGNMASITSLNVMIM